MDPDEVLVSSRDKRSYRRSLTAGVRHQLHTLQLRLSLDREFKFDIWYVAMSNLIGSTKYARVFGDRI
jgi:hypothetical protein